MSRERVHELWTLYLDERISPAEKRELLDALEADPRLREELLADGETDGLLRSARADGDAFARAFADRVASEMDGSRFVRRVTDKLRLEPRRRPRRPTSRASVVPALVGAGIAAAALVAVAVLALRPPPAARESAERERFEREEMESEILAEERQLGAERASARARLEEIEREKSRLVGERLAEAERLAGIERARLEAQAAREKLLKEERERVSTPLPAPVPEPAPRRPETVAAAAAFATLEEVEGEVYVLGPAGRAPARAGQPLSAGQGVETVGAASRALVRSLDRTTLAIEGTSKIREISERPSPGSRGKFVRLERGTLVAAVTPQPAGRTMVLETAHARARVLGTELRLVAGKESTRVDVRHGQVRLTRPSGGTALDLGAGQSALAAPGKPLAAREIRVVRSFTLVDGATDQPIAGYDPLPEGAVLTLAELPTRRINFRANLAGPTPGSVRFEAGGLAEPRIEKTAPFTLAGNDRVQAAWKPTPGRHTMTATPYGDDRGSSDPGWGLTLRFEIR